MQSRKSDFSVGLIIILAVILLFAGVIWLKDINIGSRLVTYTAVFSNVGGLQAGDPVSVNGVKKGAVKRVYLRDEKVAVVFAVDDGVVLTDSSLVTVKNVGLLGERNIEVTLRSAGAPVHVNSDTDTVFIDGSFDSGIAEAIGMFGDILNQATGLVDTVEYLINNTLASPQFITFFTTQLDRIDEITLLTESLISANDDNISRIIDDLTVAGEKVKNITVDNEENLQAITTNFSEFSQRALMLENQIDTTVQNLKSISAKVDTGSGTAAHLINESDLRIQLEETLLAVDSLVQVVDEDGLKLLIRLGTRKRWERD